ncbi:MAG: hypothetical protein EPN38_11385 [Rhodanobacteraceae bacterium]|nr:MAG: hypothetical protein EPN38_11385 [Rhodanobacteraceae bacterium]
MADPFAFAVNGEAFVGYTLPGRACVRIHGARDQAFLVAFDPIVDRQQHRVTSGVWSEIGPATDLTLLRALAPQVLRACEARYQELRNLRTKGGARKVNDRHIRRADGFDSDYLVN